MQVTKEIIEGCKRFDRRSEFKLYEICYPYLMGIAYRYPYDSGDKTAAVNGAFLKILKNLPQYLDHFPFTAWIRKIMINTLIDEYRKNKKENDNHVPIHGEKEMALNGIHIGIDESQAQYDVEELLILVQGLQPTTATVFNLFVLDGYSHREISEMLEISEAASKWHLFTARKQLQEKLMKTMAKEFKPKMSNIQLNDYEE
jgi:RNA polymerase sigma factor (sigma-70 family)